MMQEELIFCFAHKMQNDPRIGPFHISLFLALVWKAARNSTTEITAEDIRAICKISAEATYYKCLRELSLFGYLRYTPARNHYDTTVIEFDNRQFIRIKRTKN